ncbi:PREDICTED: protein S-acyltransferase 10 [Tarenaya hassleriana]|uniref:protein S-acyltransferase 10 n=1 Tax=Tarenaya hassleriana TaxID=28532 RepID=UPI00053CA0DB|nr:PREDICTED: protein S-acyltransferase 10 [Tarenaya hassleriana]
MGVCSTFLHARDSSLRLFPCLSDPVRRSSLFLKVSLVALHLVFLGVLFLFDAQFLHKTQRDPWYMGSFFFLFFATLLQYFVTSGSSPGYVVDAMRDACDTNAVFVKTPTTSNEDNLLRAKNDSLVVTVEGGQSGSRVNLNGGNATSWPKLVLGMYPPGTSVRNLTCCYCHVEQPPRAKHCHDCDRCVLQFDHHCVWLGTCIGQGNHCKFWWYICEETALCIWTFILYIEYLKDNISRVWWKDAIIILLLVILAISLIFVLLLLLFHSYLILTNQTTYELVRRRRIPYLRNIPERVHPFSRGIRTNLYNFCCGHRHHRRYYLEPLPTAYELEEKSRSYTCFDLLKCRCC